MDGEEFAVGDLMVGKPPAPDETLLPQVEPHVADAVATYVELYAALPATLDGTTVIVEIADDVETPTLTSVEAGSFPGPRPTARSAQAVLQTVGLPPGQYVARVKILRDGQPAGLLARPFVIAPAGGLARVVVPAGLLAAVPAFDRATALSPDVVGTMLDLVQRASPGLTEALAAARAGRYGVAALEALTAGDQPAAMFLRGLDHLVKGQIDQAAVQFDTASGPRREYFPAGFYLGVCFAAAGRDQEAAGIWQLAIGGEPRPPIVYALFADARLRTGQPASVLDVLVPARARLATDDEIAKRLALAHVLTGDYAGAVPVLEDYLTRHPADETALFAVVMAQYEVVSRDGAVLSDADRARFARYVKAYKGPQQALLGKYLEVFAPR